MAEVDMYAAVDDVCRVYHLTRATVYGTAFRYRWRRQHRDGHVYYHWLDVDATVTALIAKHNRP
jgi:hypothetical protein